LLLHPSYDAPVKVVQVERWIGWNGAIMSSSMRVRAMGRGLVIVSLVLLAFRVAVYLASRLLMLAGYVGGLLFVSGVALWFIGSVMTGYTDHSPRNP
jgi:hypothetical protein